MCDLNEVKGMKLRMKKKKITILLAMLALLTLTGCTKNLKDNDKKVVQNTETGQTLVENILCQPENETTIKLYKDNGVDIDKLPKCKNFKITSGGYEGIWTTIFVKPLAWVILKLGQLVKNYGVSVILITILIRLILYPMTQKSAMQSENMKAAQPELERLEKKYKNKTDQESMMQKSQEMMLIYKKHNINLMSGCIFSVIQIPLFFAFYEAMNRIPALFEETFLGFHLGTSPVTAFSKGNYLYLIFVVLVIAATYFSFKLNKTTSMNEDQAKQMKMMTNMSVIFISIASFSISTGVELYWIFNSAFTIAQNLWVKRGKKNANII